MKLFLVLAALLTSPLRGTAEAAPPHGRMVLVAITGPEDLMKLGAPYHHALVMKKTGRLEDVAIVVYGRAVAAVSTQVKSIPEPLQADIKATLEAGIHVYVCAHALENAGIPREALISGVEVVPQGAAKIAELVSQNFVPMQY